MQTTIHHLTDEFIPKHFYGREHNKVYQQLTTLILNQLHTHQTNSSLLHPHLSPPNYIFLTHPTPPLFHPPPLYPHTQFHLRITTLFPPFTQHFYDQYQNHFPLPKRPQKTLQFYPLYLF
ncbi:fructosamine kinase family protein, partial [Staphylococcus capitis]|uniref:fructosamine kinase family protein n=1 Tax=Staphylococcus capitis TaxID=29388 RepID=UPI0037099704